MTEQRRLTFEERQELKRRIHEARKLSPMEFRIAEQTELALERLSHEKPPPKQEPKKQLSHKRNARKKREWREKNREHDRAKKRADRARLKAQKEGKKTA